MFKSPKGNFNPSNPDKINICEYCGKPIIAQELYIIYKLIVVTNIQYHFLNLLNLLDNLSDFATQQGLHLSASQILLLRPDILKIYLNKHFYPEEAIYWFLCESEICMTCYSKYKLLIPER